MLAFGHGYHVIQGLQIVLEGIEGGAPQQPAQPPPQQQQPIQSGTSGWGESQPGGGGYPPQRTYGYGQRGAPQQGRGGRGQWGR